MTDSSHVPDDLLAHAAFVRRLARGLAGDEHAAEDVVQSTWLRGLERPPERTPFHGGELRGWLARVARNLVRQERRGESRRTARERAVSRGEALPSARDALERTEALQRVVDAVRALEEPYRATILARFYEDLPPRAIARRDGVSVETVYSRLKRGLARLRESLGREGREWRGALGVLAGESACLPSSSGAAEILVLMKTKAVVVGVVVLFAGWGLWSAGVPRGPRAGGGGVAPAGPEDAALAVAATREPVEAAPAVAITVSGRVTNESGEPVPEARVHVLGLENPFPALPPDIGWNRYVGRTFACDADGRWRAELAAAVRVLCVRESSEGLEPVGIEERWVDAPATGVDFVVRRLPTTTLEVRVVEGPERRALDDFAVALHGGATVLPDGGTEYTGGFTSAAAENGVVRRVLAIHEPRGRRLHVVLTRPELGGTWARLGLADPPRVEAEVWLEPGETEEVVLVVPERGVVRGRCVDERGAPVAGALVFFGAETRARGDEPFEPLREERIRDGARTGADGWFELAGDGALVTAVHADLCVATVPVAQSGRIELRDRGAIAGRLLDASGVPVAGAEVLRGSPWDGRERSVRAATDAAGVFRFDGVEAGAHALWRDTGDERGELLLAVRIAPGEEVEVELRLGELVTPELDLSALPGDARGLGGVLVGRDASFGLAWIEDGAVQGGVRPGRYWLATRTGVCAELVVRAGAPRVRVEPGSAELVVRARRRANVQLVPAHADAFTRLLAARAWVKAEGDLEARFRVAPGRYALVGEAGRVLREVDVPLEGARVALE